MKTFEEMLRVIVERHEDPEMRELAQKVLDEGNEELNEQTRQ